MKQVAKTLFELENVLAEELLTLGATDVKVLNRAVKYKGDKRMLYKANYCLRSAMSVLLPVSEFSIRSKDDLYRGGEKIEWENYLDPDGTFSVTPVVNSPLFPHTGYAGLLLKDSIVDRFRRIRGKRPSVNTGDPGIIINLHISNDNVTISLDSSAVPLFKRGYRKEQSAAPLNEVLAAGMLLISGWDGSCPLIDPMCGSGTISVEAALIARKIPPGKFRDMFGFQKWSDFDIELFESVKEECDGNISCKKSNIYCSDISDEAVKFQKYI